MRECLPWVIVGIGSYLLGSVPTGLLVTRAKGIDIRKVGSGNIGATNVFRALGKWWGGVTLFADALKGFVPAFVFPLLVKQFLWGSGVGAQSTVESTALGTHLALMCSALAVAGHNWPIYLRFKGGKGVATSAGALIGLAPWAALAGFGAWLVVFIISRYVSLASISAALVIAVTAWFKYRDSGLAMPATLTGLALVLVWRHRGNIGRLLRGEENKIERRNRKQEMPADQ